MTPSNDPCGADGDDITPQSNRSVPVLREENSADDDLLWAVGYSYDFKDDTEDDSPEFDLIKLLGTKPTRIGQLLDKCDLECSRQGTEQEEDAKQGTLSCWRLMAGWIFKIQLYTDYHAAKLLYLICKHAHENCHDIFKEMGVSGVRAGIYAIAICRSRKGTGGDRESVEVFQPFADIVAATVKVLNLHPTVIMSAVRKFGEERLDEEPEKRTLKCVPGIEEYETDDEEDDEEECDEEEYEEEEYYEEVEEDGGEDSQDTTLDFTDEEEELDLSSPRAIARFEAEHGKLAGPDDVLDSMTTYFKDGVLYSHYTDEPVQDPNATENGSADASENLSSHEAGQEEDQGLGHIGKYAVGHGRPDGGLVGGFRSDSRASIKRRLEVVDTNSGFEMTMLSYGNFKKPRTG